MTTKWGGRGIDSNLLFSYIIPLLKILNILLAHNFAIVVSILPQESLRIVVGVDVDLCNGIVCGRLIDSLMNTRFQP